MKELFRKILETRFGCTILVLAFLMLGLAVAWLCFRGYDKVSDMRHASYLHTVRFGYIDKTGKLIIPCQFIKASPFKNGVAFVQREKDSAFFYIDTLGRKVTSTGLPELIPDSIKETKSGKHYPKDEDVYKAPVNPSYPNAPAESDYVFRYTGKKEAIEPYADNLAVSRVFYDHYLYPKYSKIFLLYRYGFQDTTGKLIIPANFYDAKSFSGGLAPVQDTLQKDKSLWGYINTSGQYVIKPSYLYAMCFSQGRAAVARIVK